MSEKDCSTKGCIHSMLFTTPQAAKLARLSERTIQRWAKSFILPNEQGGAGRNCGHKWSFRDLVALRAAAQLREQGASLQALKAAVTYLRKFEGHDQPLAQSLVVSDGGDLVLITGSGPVDIKKDRGQISMIKIKPLLRELERDIKMELQRLKPKKKLGRPPGPRNMDTMEAQS
jgi:DNA-binding transcriptional MerR regulator